MIPRYLVSLIAGTLMTFLLLWVMQVLIATGKKAVVNEADFSLGDFIRVQKEEVVRRDEDEPEPPPEVDEPPPETPDTQVDDLDTSQSLSIGGPAGKIELSMQGGRIGLGDGDFLPIVKVAPLYPRRAQTRGLEGQCLIEFTVTTTGTVTDARAVECTSSLFEKASVNAALKFKYKPRVEDGVPQEVRGVQHIITFKLED
jgi:protein TonB